MQTLCIIIRIIITETFYFLLRLLLFIYDSLLGLLVSASSHWTLKHTSTHRGQGVSFQYNVKYIHVHLPPSTLAPAGRAADQQQAFVPSAGLIVHQQHVRDGAPLTAVTSAA